MVVAGIIMGIVVFGIFTWEEKKKGTEHSSIQNQIVLPILMSGGDASWENCMREIAGAYMEQHPEVRVEIRATGNNEGMDYEKSLLIEAALGNFDGIVEMKNIQLYAKEDKIVPLPEELTQLIERTSEIDQTVYSLPRFYTCRGIIYNKKLFETLQLKVPTTYTEFLELCEQLKKSGIPPLVIGAGDSWHLNQWMNGLFRNDVRQKFPDWIRLRNEGNVHWTDEEPLKMIQHFYQLFENGYVEQNYLTTSDSDTIGVLTEGKAAMLYSGTWMFSQIQKKDPEFEIGWFFLPNDETEPFVEVSSSWEWTITSSCANDTKRYEVAVDFLKFYYSPDTYVRVLQNMNGISVLKEEVSYPSIPVQQEILDEVRRVGIWETEALDKGDVPEGFINSLDQHMINLISGRQNILETAEMLDKEWDYRSEEEK